MLRYVLALALISLIQSCAVTERETVANAEITSMPKNQELQWTDARELRVEGQGWTDTANTWDRLPARAEGLVTETVWRLSHDTAGICVRFLSDAPEIHAFWSGGSAMYHMPQNGVSGLDLYHRNGDGEWEWIGIGRPKNGWSEDSLAAAPREGTVEYLLFLPLYHKVDKLLIGVEPGSTLEPAPERPGGDSARIIFYGTSITQGGCASRTGMSHPAILSRWLDREVINLGFSASGKMEIEMADLLTEQEAALYVLECLPNMNLEMVQTRVDPFVRRLREKRPDTPILLAEHCIRPHDDNLNMALRAIYDELVGDGIKNLHYLPNTGMMATREEGTIDGTHPTDLGFLALATFYEPKLREILR